MLALLQFVAFVAVAAYLYRLRAGLRRRNAQSWDALIAHLRPDWSARQLTDFSFSGPSPTPAPLEKWKRIRDADGLWTIYRNAGVMLEMADYAARNSDSFDLELLTTLRRESMYIRVLVLAAFAKYAFNAARETVWMSTLRVESAYAEMAVRITELLEVAAPDALPAFVAAM
jgi:hypothetical protein